MAAVSGVEQRSESLKFDYMKLLVTQLQNQNPLEPMDNADMTAQLTQISQLEQLEAMNTTFTDALTAAQGRYATGLIGKQISFLSQDGAEALQGRVAGVEVVDGGFQLLVNNQRVALDAVSVIGE